MIMVFLRKGGITLLLIVGTTFAFLLTMFLFWGAGGSINPFTSKQPVAMRINKDKITQQAFENAVESVRRQYSRSNLAPDEVERRAVGQLINQVLLQQQLQVLDIGVSKQEVDQQILDTAYSYYEMLNKQGRGKAFRESLRNQLALSRLYQLVQNLAVVTDEEVRSTYRERNEKMKIKFIKFRNSQFQGAAEISDDEALAHFNADPEAYRLEDRIAIQYLKIDPKQFEKPVDEAAYLTYYNDNRLTEFSAPAGEIWARHILFKLDEDADEVKEQEVLQKAKEVLAEARAEGADFAELARQYSEGPTASKGGDLGFFGKGQMVKEFEDAAFALEPGQISDPVKSPFGYHIIKREPDTKPYELVKEEIRQKLQAQVADEAASEAHEHAVELLYDSQAYGFEVVAEREQYKALGIELKTTPLFSKEDSNIENLGYRWDHQPLIDAAFDLRKEEISDIIEVKRGDKVTGYFIARVIDRQPSRIPEFDEVKDKIISELKREKAAQLAYDAAQALMAKRTGDETLDDLAPRFEATEASLMKEAKVEETDFFAFASHGYISPLGTAPEVMSLVFALSPGDVRGPVKVQSLGSYLIEIVEKQDADLASFESNQEEWLKLYQELLNQKKNQVYQAWLDSVKAHSRIERIEPQLARR